MNDNLSENLNKWFENNKENFNTRNFWDRNPVARVIKQNLKSLNRWKKPGSQNKVENTGYNKALNNPNFKNKQNLSCALSSGNAQKSALSSPNTQKDKNKENQFNTGSKPISARKREELERIALNRIPEHLQDLVFKDNWNLGDPNKPTVYPSETGDRVSEYPNFLIPDDEDSVRKQLRIIGEDNYLRKIKAECPNSP